MSATTAFLLAAGALLLGALAILLWPLLRRNAATMSAVDRRQANLAILRDELRELERSRDEGSLNEADFEQARRELQRRLLEEVEPADKRAPAPAAGGKRTAIALLVALPLAAAGGYAMLGNPQGLDPVHTQARMSQQEIDALLQKLVDRLNANPNDTQGWIMLARSYRALGRYAESADAFGRAEAAFQGDATLLAEYAETLAESRGGNFAGKPDELIARALKASPDEPMALFVAGESANTRRDFAAIVDYWGRLLLQVEPGSQDARTLGAAVDQARELLASQGATPAGKKSPPAAAAKAVSGEVMLSGKLSAQAKPEDPVFIFARPADGSSRMPLAVLRITVADLPYRFRLDDSTAMQGGQKLSEVPAVALEARIARAGMATRSAGDLFGVAENTKVGSQDVRLVIDQVQP